MTHKALPGRLTAGEHRVLTEAARGGTLDEVAARLYLAHATVKTSLRRATRRMGATNTTHLLALAIATGQITPDVAAGTAVQR